MKPLSIKQKAALAQMARRAFDHLTAKGQIANISADDWRRDECERVTGQPGLRQCDGDSYNKLAAHFESLAGEDGRALEHILKEGSEPKRRAEVALVRAMESAGLGPAWVAKLCRDRFKCDVIDANPTQLHQLIITVKTRAKSRRAPHSQPSTVNPA